MKKYKICFYSSNRDVTINTRDLTEFEKDAIVKEMSSPCNTYHEIPCEGFSFFVNERQVLGFSVAEVVNKQEQVIIDEPTVEIEEIADAQVE